MTNFQALLYCLFVFVMWLVIPWRIILTLFRLWFWWTVAKAGNTVLVYAKRKFDNIKLPRYEEKQTVQSEEESR